jgi:hypothetical protein
MSRIVPRRPRNANRRLAAALLAAALCLGLIAPAAAQTRFSYTGSVQTYTVPLGVGSVTMQLAGSGGGGGGADQGGAGGAGGNGATVSGTLLVPPGSVLYIYVGGGGQPGFASNFGHTCTSSAGAGGVAAGTAGLTGGAGGQAGCSGWSGGGGGGGAATVVTNSSGTVLMVAGGGGGGEGGSLNSTSIAGASSSAPGTLAGAAGSVGTSRGSSADGGAGGGGGAGCPNGAGGPGHADSSGTNYGAPAGAGGSCYNATYVKNFQILGTAGGVGGTGDSASNGSSDSANGKAGGNGSATVTAIAGPDHYAVTASGSAVNCAPTAVTITAHTSTHTAIATVNTITLGTSTGHGDWSLSSGGGAFTAGPSNSGTATYTYVSADTGVGVFALRDTYPETVTINVSDGTATATSGAALASEDSPIAFAPSGFIVTNGANVATPIGTQIAGRASTQNLALQAVRTDTNTGACTTVFASGTTANISLAYQCNNPTTCIAGQTLAVADNGITINIASNPASGVSTYTAVPLRFSTANAEAPISLTYSDAGQITLYVRYNIPLASGAGSGNLMNGSSQFVVQPYTFVISNLKCTTYGAGTCSTALGTPGNNPTAASAAGAAFIPAGEPFTATVTAQNFSGAATPNYGREVAPPGVTLAVALVAPSGGDAAALNNASTFGAWSNGAATGTAFSWPEVGLITLTPAVANYLGSGPVTGTLSGNIGRFYPNSFAVTENTPVFGTACSAGSFSYIGQPLTYAVAPVATVTAQALGGMTTRNYTGAFMKLTNTSLSGRTYTPTPASPLLDLSGLPTVDPAIADLGTGQVSLAFSAGTGLAFVRGGPIVPFNANIALGISIIDTDGVAVSSINGSAAANPVTFGGGSGIAFSVSSVQYYGRLALRDSVGSELLDLPMPLTTQYYSGNTVGFTTNTADSCTSAPKLAFSNYQLNLASGATCVRDAGNPGASGIGCATPAAAGSQYDSIAAAGNFNLILAAPGASHNGALSVTATAPSWLQYTWGGGVYGNPSAMGTFGEFPAPASRVHQREVY